MKLNFWPFNAVMTEEGEEARGALNAARFLATQPSARDAAEYYATCMAGYSPSQMLNFDRAYNRGVRLVFEAAGLPDKALYAEAQRALDLKMFGFPNFDATQDGRAAHSAGGAILTSL